MPFPVDFGVINGAAPFLCTHWKDFYIRIATKVVKYRKVFYFFDEFNRPTSNIMFLFFDHSIFNN